MFILILKIILGIWFISSMLCICVMMVQIDKLLNDIVNMYPDELCRGFIRDLWISFIVFILCFIPIVNLFLCLIVTLDKDGIKESVREKMEGERNNGGN